MSDAELSAGAKRVDYLYRLLQALEQDMAVTVKKNAALPDDIDDEGWVIVRDGEVTILDELLGEEGPFYKSHAIPVEILVQARTEDAVN